MTNEQTQAADIVPAQTEQSDLAQVPDNPIMAMVQAVERLATNPDVTPDKITMILDAQERILDRQAKMAYTRAMAQFREKCPQIIKDQAVGYATKKGGQVGYMHASLAGTISQVQSLLHQCGLSHSWRTEQPQQGFVQITCIITHSEGHSEQTSITLPYDTSGQKNAIQSVGSAQSYGQRYTMFSMLGLASAPDDDGLAGAPAAPQPLAKARNAQKARQARPEPDQQPAAATAPGNEPKTPAQPKTEADPQPPAKNGLSEAQKQERRDFAQVCTTLALDHGVIEVGGKLAPEDFRALLNQAMAMAGTRNMVDATKYMMSDVQMIVRDSAGIRIINQ